MKGADTLCQMKTAHSKRNMVSMLVNISDSGQTFENLVSRIMCFNVNKKQIKDFGSYKGSS